MLFLQAKSVCRTLLKRVDELEVHVAAQEKNLQEWEATGDRIMEYVTGKRAMLSESDVMGEFDRCTHMLKELLDAADAFLVEPPDGSLDWEPWHQYTTVKDCRKLNAIHRKARAFLEERKQS